MATTFDVLAEPSRRDILDLLREGERSPNGQRRMYELRAEPLVEIDAWLGPYRRLWSKRLDALERHLDEED